MRMTISEDEHLTRPLQHEQCYLCIMSIAASPPDHAATRETLRRDHKRYLADLESRGLLFGAGKFGNMSEGEQTDFGVGMFILRAKTRAEAEAIAFQEPYTKAGWRSMRLVPWQRTEGDIALRISFTNGVMSIDGRTFDIVARG
jgi:uncharacterized protein YciI